MRDNWALTALARGDDLDLIAVAERSLTPRAAGNKLTIDRGRNPSFAIAQFGDEFGQRASRAPASLAIHDEIARLRHILFRLPSFLLHRWPPPRRRSNSTIPGHFHMVSEGAARQHSHAPPPVNPIRAPISRRR